MDGIAYKEVLAGANYVWLLEMIFTVTLCPMQLLCEANSSL